MRNYVEITYQTEEKPFREYPLQLAQHLIRKNGTPKMKLLDNGCGRGEFLHAFRQMRLDIYGADPSSYCPDAKVVDYKPGQPPLRRRIF